MCASQGCVLLLALGSDFPLDMGFYSSRDLCVLGLWKAKACETQLMFNNDVLLYFQAAVLHKYFLPFLGTEPVLGKRSPALQCDGLKF